MTQGKKMRVRTGAIGAAILVALVMSSCASRGLLESGHSRVAQTFWVDADQQAALRRASEYVRVCHEERIHPFGATYAAKRLLGERGAANEVRVYRESEPAKILELIQTQEGERPNQAQVVVTVLGEQNWDAAEIAAAKQSIQSATPVCRADE